MLVEHVLNDRISDVAEKERNLDATPKLDKELIGDTEEARVDILLVEDDDADAYIILEALKNLPKVKSVVRAQDGLEALEIVDAGNFVPHLALVDLSMPRMNGFALLADLKARAQVEFPAVVLTSSRAEMDVFRAGKNGAWKYITKKEKVNMMTQSLRRIIKKI
ncbi:response regulator [Novosphingobium sp. KACC 22771]|uniref:response regulator n=1 Tax=Novosphingobium sp. KACC 22771 TaxID=3025670 RepID=UPI002365DA64|nr:response regulator [Novosphingobium sp. KACC 22771]WDF71951.1 response regulator [Novosphingobium sp. KACC 22771]